MKFNASYECLLSKFLQKNLFMLLSLPYEKFIIYASVQRKNLRWLRFSFEIFKHKNCFSL